MSYTTQAISGYNTSPPDDDGSQTEANRVKWSTIKSKLADPIKTLAEAINTELVSYSATRFGNAVETFSTTKTIDGNDEGSIQVFTGTSNTTVTLPSAATVGSDWVVGIRNDGTATLTIDGDGSETISGDLTKTLESGQSELIVSDGTNWVDIGSSPDQLNQTGMIAPFLLSSAPNGWVALDRSVIGSSTSGATDDASDNNRALFLSLHGSLSDVEAPVIKTSTDWLTVGSVDIGADTITINSHGLLSNAKVVLIDGGSATNPTNINFGRVYYVANPTTNTFQLSATAGPGAAVNITSTGSGTLYIAEVNKGTAQTDWDNGLCMVMPDFRGRTVIGTGTGLTVDAGVNGTLTARALGDEGGTETHALSESEMPSHYHLLINDSNSSTKPTDGGAADYLAYANPGSYTLAGVGSAPDLARSATTGSGTAHENMQPWMAALWCIKK